MTKLTTIFSRLDLTPTVLVIYLLSLGISRIFNINLYYIPGLIAVFYLPGRNLLSLFPTMSAPWKMLGQFALAVFCSVSLIVTVLLATAHRAEFNGQTQIALLLFGNVLLYTAAVLITKKRQPIGQSYRTLLTGLHAYTRLDWAGFVVLSSLMIALLAMNPYVQDADHFLTVFANFLTTNTLDSSLRPMFSYFLASNYYTLGLPYTLLYRALFVALFFISTLFLFDYIAQKIDRHLKVISYLLILAAPVILTEINIVRPQVAVLMFTLPVIFLSIQSISKRDIRLSLLSLWFSVVSLTFHELSATLLLLSLFPLVYNLAWLTFIEKKLRPSHYLWFVVIALPYYFLLPFDTLFHQAASQVAHALQSFPEIVWRWWFINHYQTIDGLQLGWPGLQAIYYYLYNGILLVPLTIVVLLQGKSKITLRFFVPLLFTAMFLFFAEILPRLGLFFLPNRAWPFLMLGLLVTTILGLERLRNKVPLINLYAMVIILCGLLGSLYVGQHNISEVYPQEVQASRFLNQQPANSLVLSTQNNRVLVMFYAHRNYYQIAPPASTASFTSQIDQKLTDLSVPQLITVKPEVVEERKTFIDKVLTSDITQVVQKRVEKSIPALYEQNKPVYFIYSYRKINAISRQRPYLSPSLDIENGPGYAKLGYPIVYQDANVLILKLR